MIPYQNRTLSDESKNNFYFTQVVVSTYIITLKATLCMRMRRLGAHDMPTKNIRPLYVDSPELITLFLFLRALLCPRIEYCAGIPNARDSFDQFSAVRVSRVASCSLTQWALQGGPGDLHAATSGIFITPAANTCAAIRLE
jgi:hypothetical protein